MFAKTSITTATLLTLTTATPLSPNHLFQSRTATCNPLAAVGFDTPDCSALNPAVVGGIGPAEYLADIVSGVCQSGDVALRSLKLFAASKVSGVMVSVYQGTDCAEANAPFGPFDISSIPTCVNFNVESSQVTAKSFKLTFTA